MRSSWTWGFLGFWGGGPKGAGEPASSFGEFREQGGQVEPPHLAECGNKGAKQSLLIRRNAGTRGLSGASSSGEIREQGGQAEPPHSAKFGERGASMSLLIQRNRRKGATMSPHKEAPGRQEAVRGFCFLQFLRGISTGGASASYEQSSFNYISISTTFSTASRRSSLTRRSVIFSSSSYIWTSLSWAMKSSLDRTRS